MLDPEKRPQNDPTVTPQLGAHRTREPLRPDLREGLRIPRRFTEPGVHP